MADPNDTHRGWSMDDGRNEGLQDRSRRTEQLNRESNNAQYAEGGKALGGQRGFAPSSQDDGGGGYGRAGQSQPYGQARSSGFGQGGQPQDRQYQGGQSYGGQDYTRGQNSYAPGAEIWQDGSNYNPTGYHQQQGGAGGQYQGGFSGGGQDGGRPPSGYGPGFGASSGFGGNAGAGGFGQQGQGSQGANYPGGRQGGERSGASGFGSQGGGSYGQGDYSESARRSTYRQDQNYGGAGAQQSGYQGQQGHEDHDPDYLSWRDNQLSSYDRDYSAWREEQRRKHDEDYGRWRSEKKEHFGQKFHEWRSKAASAVGLGGSTDGAGDSSGGQARASSEPAKLNPLGVGDNPNVSDVADGGTGDRDPKNN